MMQDFPANPPHLQSAKSLVRDHYSALAEATPQTVAKILSNRMSKDVVWRGMHPFHVQTGPIAVAETFWGPFLRAFSNVQRREDIFFAGLNQIDGFQGTWVASMGHLMGLFDAPFLGIPATRKIAMIRYAEFNRVEDGRIVETALFVDLLHLMIQAGLQPLLAEQTGAHLIQPGPLTHDGQLFEPQEAVEGQRTLHRINTMIGAIDHANAATVPLPPEEELAQDWHNDMIWWGPAGIGATYTIPRYVEQHQGPFRRKISDRAFNGHVCRMAEGTYGGFFGWPNLTLSNTGDFMGVPASDVRADMRVVDIYRRSGDRLAENWVFIDMLHFMKMQGVDVLADLVA